MQLFDLHCDTLYKAYTENGSVVHNDYHFSFERALQYDCLLYTSDAADEL